MEENVLDPGSQADNRDRAQAGKHEEGRAKRTGRTVATLTASVGLLAASVIAAAPATAAIPYGPPYEFINNGSHLCLDVAYGSTAAGARIQQWWCYNGLPERWQMNYVKTIGVTDYFELVNQNQGGNMCLDVPNGNPAEGTPLQLWPCWGGDMQLWAVEFTRPDRGRNRAGEEPHDRTVPGQHGLEQLSRHHPAAVGVQRPAAPAMVGADLKPVRSRIRPPRTAEKLDLGHRGTRPDDQRPDDHRQPPQLLPGPVRAERSATGKEATTR